MAVNLDELFNAEEMGWLKAPAYRLKAGGLFPDQSKEMFITELENATDLIPNPSELAKKIRALSTREFMELFRRLRATLS